MGPAGHGATGPQGHTATRPHNHRVTGPHGQGVGTWYMYGSWLGENGTSLRSSSALPPAPRRPHWRRVHWSGSQQAPSLVLRVEGGGSEKISKRPKAHRSCLAAAGAGRRHLQGCWGQSTQNGGRCYQQGPARQCASCTICSQISAHKKTLSIYLSTMLHAFKFIAYKNTLKKPKCDV